LSSMVCKQEENGKDATIMIPTEKLKRVSTRKNFEPGRKKRHIVKEMVSIRLGKREKVQV